MSKQVCEVIDDLFRDISDPIELKYQVKILVKTVHEADCKQSVVVFGVNRHNKAGFIKDAILNQTMPLIEFQK